MAKSNLPVYGTVCLDWNGKRVYTSFSSNLDELIKKADNQFGIIEIEEAHAGKPPVWKRD